MNSRSPFTIRYYNGSGQNIATKSAGSVATAETAVLSFLIPAHIRAEMKAFAAMNLEMANRETTKPTCFMAGAVPSGHVLVEYNNREVGRFTIHDVPPFVGADPEELIANRIRGAVERVRDLPPLPRGKRQREFLELVVCEFNVSEEEALDFLDKARPYLK